MNLETKIQELPYNSHLRNLANVVKGLLELRDNPAARVGVDMALDKIKVFFSAECVELGVGVAPSWMEEDGK